MKYNFLDKRENRKEKRRKKENYPEKCKSPSDKLNDKLCVDPFWKIEFNISNFYTDGMNLATITINLVSSMAKIVF